VDKQQQQQQALCVSPWCYQERPAQLDAWAAAASSLLLPSPAAPGSVAAAGATSDESQHQQQQELQKGSSATGAAAAAAAAALARQQQHCEYHQTLQQLQVAHLSEAWQQRQQQLAAARKLQLLRGLGFASVTGGSELLRSSRLYF
jgi:hypothetical protein